MSFAIAVTPAMTEAAITILRLQGVPEDIVASFAPIIDLMLKAALAAASPADPLALIDPPLPDDQDPVFRENLVPVLGWLHHAATDHKDWKKFPIPRWLCHSSAIMDCCTAGFTKKQKGKRGTGTWPYSIYELTPLGHEALKKAVPPTGPQWHGRC